MNYGVNAQADALEVVSRIPGRSRLPCRNAGKPEISTGHPTRITNAQEGSTT